MSDNYERLIPATVAFDERGTPMSPAFGDVYHPAWGALEQARRVFLHGNSLPRRWQGKDSFTVCETGFGLGNNFLALWQAWRDDPQRCARLHVLSFEAHPFARQDLGRILAGSLPQPEKALASQLVAAWPPLLPGLHRLEFEGGSVTLTLAFGSVARLAKQACAEVDAYFLDGFAPRVNPDMWTRGLFGQLVRMANQGATAATWCCAGEVRRGLRDAGFLVSKAPGFGGKREITVATLRPGMGRGHAARPPREPALVVGGGLAGAGIAQALALRGHEVTLLDPVFAGGLGASHRGHIAAAMTPVISRDDDIRARLSRAGVSRALQRWQGLPGDARPWRCGTIELVPDAREASRCRDALAYLGFPDDWVGWLDAPEASRRAGRALACAGLWFADGQRVQPQALLEALLYHPRIHCKVGRAARLQTDGAGLWRALDAQGKELASAALAVLANAGQAAALLATVPGVPRLPKVEAIYSLAGQVSYYSGGETASLRAVLAGDGYCLPPVDGRSVGGSTYLQDAAVSEVTLQGHLEINKKVAGLLNVVPCRIGQLPGPGDGWAGWRAAVSDRLPVIGPIDDVPGLWLACAYGSRGLSWAALAGDVIAAALDHEPLPLERELLRRISPR
ncbi:FAD-dependent 5-carboxymethylaminomethyl-2-thiouridine(34) oxidoreductase MnmC [Pollutimonas bauzanensis]|uniref:tRNA 5-methylaminomethyl-2-thiouridine biosynthesis bifunctional protein MnmC n=1 Tax=Pollutimonas bauzanensis TaxID=658167 RepID=A0A1M5WVM4_9BURK|nr:FAD-dependent 5-carboxymethylaminomethyl-2-thiouridine(34) oxidoreductase MnmC [Pollutimonas bauzanensis]SHH91666.1 tRNA 5-methylaminomethyl-2-thiouridine biosynthesis bifunctional protein [Pollutimonas bauzanensis]